MFQRVFEVLPVGRGRVVDWLCGCRRAGFWLCVMGGATRDRGGLVLVG